MKCLVPPVTLLLLLTTFLSVAQENPQRSQDGEFGKSISERTEDSKNHKTLLAALKAIDLEETLDEDGPFTVFAPSDIAFQKLSADKVASLLHPENKKELHSVITYHIVAGELTASKILKAMCRGNGTATFTTVQGNKITATLSGIDIILKDNFGNAAKITTADSNQCNGIVHEIDSVILPKKI